MIPAPPDSRKPGHLNGSLDGKATEPPLLPVAAGQSPCTPPPPPPPFGQQAGLFIIHFVDFPFFGLALRVVMRVVLAALFRIGGTSFDADHTELNSRASSRSGKLTRPPPLAIAFAFRFSEEQRSWPSRLDGFSIVKRANLLRRLSRLHCSSTRCLFGRLLRGWGRLSLRLSCTLSCGEGRIDRSRWGGLRPAILYESQPSWGSAFGVNNLGIVARFTRPRPVAFHAAPVRRRALIAPPLSVELGRTLCYLSCYLNMIV